MMRRALDFSEAQIQRAVIQHIAWRARPGMFAFHVPNGGWRSRVEGAILKAIGTVAGVPDIICIFEGRCYALELKAPKGRLTDVQCVVHERLREAGAVVAVAHGIDQRLAQLEQWQLLRGHALRRAPDGTAASLIGAVVDRLVEEGAP
jgi:hypothetical protein